MIELYQVPWSPYCLVQRRLLEFSGAEFRVINLSAIDRSEVWRLTRQRYYQVPVARYGRTVLFETGPNSQVIAKYLNLKLGLDLFPRHWRGIQEVLWTQIENEVEDCTFRLNDAYYREFVAKNEYWGYVRHKERKFGRGCLEEWRRDQKLWLSRLTERLAPYERMLESRRFLLEADQPRFVDFDLWGMLANFLYSGHYRIPSSLPKLRAWNARLSRLSATDLSK